MAWSGTLTLLIGCCAQEMTRISPDAAGGLRLPKEAGAVRLQGEERLIDADANGLAEALEIRMLLPTKAGRPAFATIEVFGQEQGSLRTITFASQAGSDVWLLAGPVVYVPVCSSCVGDDSLIVKVDGEKIRRRGISGPYVVMVELWEGSVGQAGAIRVGRYEFVTADHVASAFGWLPARVMRAVVAKEDGRSVEVLVNVLVESPIELELRGDIYEGGARHSTTAAKVPKLHGLHDVRLTFQRIRPDSGAVASPVAKVWLTAASQERPEAYLWSELWETRGHTVRVGNK